jgi:hypothetical protein
MATKKESEVQAPAVPEVPKTTAVMSIQEQIAQQLTRQNEAAQSLRSSGSYIGFKNAQLKVDGIAIPTNQLDVRVLATISERAWYSKEFDADAIQVPDCYALDDDTPHDQASNAQAATCAECPHNKWGSALRGKGKACRESARVIVIPANVPLASAQMYTAKVPVTSLSTVTSFASRCGQANKLMGEFVTKLSVVEDRKTFFKVHLTPVEVTADMDMAVLLSVQNKAYELAMTPYPALSHD